MTYHRLDPKLRRMVATQHDADRLANDIVRGAVAGSVEEPEASVTMKPVLVMLHEDRIPDGFAALRWSRIAESIFAVDVPVSRLTELAAAPGVKYVEAGRNLRPTLDTSLAATHADDVHAPATGTGLRGGGVVVGVVDFGFDFTLDDFRNPDGTTRVAFLWDQFLVPTAGEHTPAEPDFAFGVEYDRAALDAALALPNPFASVRHRPEAGSHGTHVASIAAGNGRSADANFGAGLFVGAAPEATLILVQPRSNDQQTTFTDSVNVARAISYVFRRASAMGLPCVINMSLGQNGGSHDGESVVERAIDRLLEEPGRGLVMAAGNEHVWRTHASGTLTTGTSRALQWRVGGGLPVGGGTLPLGADRTPNEMEIWLSSQGPGAGPGALPGRADHGVGGARQVDAGNPGYDPSVRGSRALLGTQR